METAVSVGERRKNEENPLRMKERILCIAGDKWLRQSVTIKNKVNPEQCHDIPFWKLSFSNPKRKGIFFLFFYKLDEKERETTLIKTKRPLVNDEKFGGDVDFFHINICQQVTASDGPHSHRERRKREKEKHRL